MVSFSIFSYASIPTNSVVKIFSTISKPNYKEPWENPTISNMTGSGAIIRDNQILTAAHVVSGGKFIEVQKENDSKKYEAVVKYISNQADLAILDIKDKNFFSNTNALELSEEVKYQDNITAIGYPVGGNSVSSTNGIISRMEYKKYAWSSSGNLAIQIDAAINPGNSGGPVMNKDNKIVGIAMQKMSTADNISYIVPAIVINTFLTDIKDGKVDGFAYTRTKTMNIENDTMKEYFGLIDSGILVTNVDIEDTELQLNDVLLSINGKRISNDGKIDSKYGRVNFNFEIDNRQIGDIVRYEILRNKTRMSVDYKIKYSKPIVPFEYDKEPKYFIYGGLTFSPLTLNYLTKLNNQVESAEVTLNKQEKNSEVTQRVIWLQTIFAHKVNRGYASNGFIVTKVNGTIVKDFNHFVNMVDNCKDEYVVIDFVGNNKVVLKTKEAKDSFADIKNTYDLKSDRRVY